MEAGKVAINGVGPDEFSRREILPISAVPDCNEFDTSDALKGWAADELTVPTFEGDRVVNSGIGILQRFGKLVSNL